MTTSENKLIIENIFNKVAKGDGSMFVEHLADEVSMKVTGQYSWSQTFKGKESVLKDLYGHVASVTQGLRKTIPFNILASGDYVVVEARGDMTNKEGIPYQNEYCMIYRLKNKKIVEMREYQDSILCERVLGAYPLSIG